MNDSTPVRALSRTLSQVGWLVLFWMLGVLSLAIVATAVRWVLPR